jgi:segregation and condensation protein A
MAYEIKLEVFEGPLDLLLYLIEKNEVSITDIPLALVTAQYLETLDLMKSLNLEVAGDYLVMAAYLTQLKSKMLLPLDDSYDGNESESGKDPRDELVAHLLEYKRYKEASCELASLEILDKDVFVRCATEYDQILGSGLENVHASFADLIDAFRSLLERTNRPDLLILELDNLSVQEQMSKILSKLHSTGILTFMSMFDEEMTRGSVVAAFLAVLELVKLRLIQLYQDSPYGTILISRSEESTNSSIATQSA